jgi:hypothetical protein
MTVSKVSYCFVYLVLFHGIEQNSRTYTYTIQQTTKHLSLILRFGENDAASYR